MNFQLIRSAAVPLVLILAAAETCAAEPEAAPPAELTQWLGPQEWKRETKGPVLSLGPAGAFDDRHMFAPCVARENGRFLMWYCGSRGTVRERVFQLGLARSADGVHFEKYRSNPVFGLDDGTSVLTPTVLRAADGTVLREDGRLRMWFSATRFTDKSGKHTLHEATSEDGIRWSNASPAQLEGVYAPSILKQGGAYRLWYTDVSRDPWLIRHATSEDGRRWNVDKSPVLVLGQTWEPGELRVLSPVRHGSLAIFPVVSTVPRHQDRFITLDEGLRDGTVEIFEVGADGERADAQPNASAQSRQDGGLSDSGNPPGEPVQQAIAGPFGGGPEVNRLMVVNRSGKPLYLMPGEVIGGGQQDRTIAEETIIASGAKPVPVDVYCVEHGRWSDRADADDVALFATLADSFYGASGDRDAAEQLLNQANRGRFVLSTGSLNKGARLKAQSGEGQQAVWQAVGEANSTLSVNSPSGAFTASYGDGKVAGNLQPYLERTQGPIAEQDRIVGVVVAIGGKIEAVDVFESTPLFRKLWPKLLKGYALDAVAAESGGSGKRCTVADAKNFLSKVMDGRVEEKAKAQGGLVVTRRESPDVVSFAAQDESAPGMGGFGGAVHASGFSK